MNKIIKRLFFLKKNVRASLAGFTLVEILIAIGIFAMLSSIFTVIYVTISKDQQRSKASQLLLNNSLYVLELMARDIKNNELDYNFLTVGAGCNRIANPQNCVVFKRVDNSLGSFTQSGEVGKEALFYSIIQCDSYPDLCNFTGSIDLLSPTLNMVRLDYLRFLVEPLADPYLDQTATSSPKVTIIMQTSYTGTKLSEQISYTLQTTVSSRIYKR